jgi:hypothetical protein
MEKNKVATIVLGVSAVLLLLAVLTKGFYSRSEGPISMGVGLWGTVKVCMGDKCDSKSASLSDMKKGKDKAWLVFGKAGFVIGLVAFLVLAVAAAMSWISNPNAATMCMAGLITSAIVLFCGLMFLILKPEEMKEIGIGYGFFLLLLGTIGGIVGSVMGKKAATGA